jgi:hypothetical protein
LKDLFAAGVVADSCDHERPEPEGVQVPRHVERSSAQNTGAVWKDIEQHLANYRRSSGQTSIGVMFARDGFTAL